MVLSLFKALLRGLKRDAEFNFLKLLAHLGSKVGLHLQPLLHALDLVLVDVLQDPTLALIFASSPFIVWSRCLLLEVNNEEL